MKTIKKLVISLISPLLLIAMAMPMALADDIIDNFKSQFTPNRPWIPFVRGVTDGLTYPSFNNFKDNEKILDSQRTFEDPEIIRGDERVFLTAKTCENGNCDANGLYDNTTIPSVTDGDKIRFSIYFHNNGEDPHDGDGETFDTTARNVKIGIDLNDIEQRIDDENENILRPFGFISASNQEYRQNSNRPGGIGNTIIDAAGNTMQRADQQPLRKATDDVQVVLGEEGLHFSVIPNSVAVEMDNVSHGGNIIEFPQTNQQIEIRIPSIDGTIVTVHATAKVQDNKLWLEFDELPGCFAYSGFAYFDVQVFKEEQPNICQDLSHNANIADSVGAVVNGRTYNPVEINNIDFSNGEIPAGTQLRFSSPDRNGDFLTGANNTSRGAGPITLPAAEGTRVLYAGLGPVTVELIDAQGRVLDNNDNPRDENACRTTVTYDNVCNSITFDEVLFNRVGAVRQPDDTFMQLLWINDVDFSRGTIPANAKLRWTSDNPNGKFFTTLLGIPIEQLPDVDNDPNTVTVETPANNAALRMLLYQGLEDAIHIEIAPDNIKAKCEINLDLKNPQICKELTVNHNDPIIEGHYSRFSSSSTDQNGDPYEGGGIEYTVDDGSGTFSDEPPEDTPESPTPFIDIVELQRREAQFSANRPAWMSIAVENTGVFDATSEFNRAQAGFNSAGNGEAQLSEETMNRLFPKVELDAEKLNKTKAPKIKPPLDFGLNSIFDINQNKKNKPAAGNIVTKPKPGQAATAGLHDGDAVEMSDAAASAAATPMSALRNPFGGIILGLGGVNSLVADANEEVYLDAEQGSNGQDVVHVQQLDENGEPTVDADGNPVCNADFPIEDLICKVLNVRITDLSGRVLGANEFMEAQNIYAVRADAPFEIENHENLGEIDDPDSGIQYSVDPSYGVLARLHPALLAVRDAQQRGATFATEQEIADFLTSIRVNPDDVLIGFNTQLANPSEVVVITFDIPGPQVINNFLQIHTTDEDGSPDEANPACDATRGVAAHVPVCLGLDHTLVEFIGGAVVDTMAPEKIYVMTASSRFGFHPPSGQLEEFTVNDPNQAVIINVNQLPGGLVRPALFAEINRRQTDPNGTFTRADLVTVVQNAGLNPANILVNTYQAQPNEQVFIVTFTANGASRDDLITITQIADADSTFELNDCVVDIPIEVPEAPICTNLNYEINGEQAPGEIAPNTVYNVRAESNFQNGDPENNEIRYSLNENYGVFILNEELEQAVRDGIAAGIPMDEAMMRTIARNINVFYGEAVSNEVTVAPGEEVTFVIYTDVPVSEDGRNRALIIYQNGFEKDGCVAEVNVVIPEEEPICIDLTYTVDGVAGRPTVDRNELYTIGAQGSFENLPNGQLLTVTYTVNDDYGTIILDQQLAGAVENAIAAGEEVTAARLAEIAQGLGIDLAVATTQITELAEDETALVLIYADAPDEGIANAIIIQQNAEGVAGLENCNAEIAVPPDVEEPELICIDLTSNLQRITNADDLVAPIEREPANIIERNSVYEVSAASQFNPEAPEPNQVRYTLDPRYGVIFNPEHEVMQNEAIRNNVIKSIGLLQEFRGFTPESMQELLATAENPEGIINNDITVDAGTTVLIATYSNAPLGAAVLRIAQVGDDIDNLVDCVVDIPIPNEDICIDLSVNARGGAFNPRANQTVFEITGNFQGHNGGIVATITEGGGTISRLGDAGQANQRSIRFFENEVQSEDVLIFVYHGDPNMARDARVTISVRAVDDANLPAGICQDTVTNQPEDVICTDLTITRPDKPWDVDENSPDRQTFNIDVDTDPSGNTSDFYYTWEVTGGGKWVGDGSRLTEKGRLQQTLENYNEDTSVRVWASEDANGNNPIPACVDNINAQHEVTHRNPPPDKKKPEIEKVVYPRNNIEKADDLINISGPDREDSKYVTYMAIFTPGSESKSVEIIEEAMKNGKIISTDGLGGYFKISDIEIIKIDEYSSKRPKGEIIYRTNTYKPDKDASNPYSDIHYDDETFIRPNVLKYDCEARDDRFCVEDLDKTIFNFGIGSSGGIRFNHVEDIGTRGRIVIKYQMVNFSEIDEESCKTLSAMSGCGEKFRNVVSYISHENVNFKGDTDEGKDRAEAVVMCPYALSRQGGDVLFHDIIDSGVDVARCSPVKGSTGVGVKIIPVPEVETPSTGAGDVEDAQVLARPTHDICKFSNQKAVKGDADYAENYNDELENFSSSVCELRAELSSTLYETSINDAIAANISRLTRWSSNLNGIDTLRTVDQLNDVENAASGVFVKTDGDLTIDASGLQIQTTNVVKGGNQTYIVIGHNLIINGDVTYGDKENPNYLKPRTIGSAAFIVIGGDIIVDKDVKEMAGIYMAVNVDAEGRKLADKGQIKANADEDSETPLVVNGGLYGNVNSLFSHRIGIGDPRYDEGSVTIKYDERLLLNMPPGIGELINVQQAIVPN